MEILASMKHFSAILELYTVVHDEVTSVIGSGECVVTCVNVGVLFFC